MATIKIKLGNLELDCEGPEEFVKAEVPNFLKLTLETYRQIPSQSSAPNATNPRPPLAGSNGNIQGTTGTIAGRLGVKKSPDLAIAAAARLVFVLGKDSFTRDELLAEMKTATAYYNANHNKNLTQTLQNLVKAGTFNEIATNSYALSATSKADIESKIHG